MMYSESRLLISSQPWETPSKILSTNSSNSSVEFIILMEPTMSVHWMVMKKSSIMPTMYYAAVKEAFFNHPITMVANNATQATAMSIPQNRLVNEFIRMSIKKPIYSPIRCFVQHFYLCCINCYKLLLIIPKSHKCTNYRSVITPPDVKNC